MVAGLAGPVEAAVHPLEPISTRFAVGGNPVAFEGQRGNAVFETDGVKVSLAARRKPVKTVAELIAFKNSSWCG